MEGSSSNLRDDDKPLIVRVKRKVFQSAIDALWLEVCERPTKRPLLDFGKLSLSDDASSSRVEEFKKKKILVEHVETVTSTKETFHILQSFLGKSSDELGSSEKVEKERRNVKSVNVMKREQLLAKAKQSQEELTKNARFEQIWRRRRGKNEGSEDESIREMCELYDIVRVDNDEDVAQVHNNSGINLEDSMMLAQYLPLLREVLPNAAFEIEHDIHGSLPRKEDDYVYDVYTVKEDAENMREEDSAGLFPLVKVEYDDDYYDGATESEYESDDSNAEHHPRNDYPEEESSDEKEEEDDDEDEMSSNSASDDEILDSEDEYEDGVPSDDHEVDPDPEMYSSDDWYEHPRWKQYNVSNGFEFDGEDEVEE